MPYIDTPETRESSTGASGELVRDRPSLLGLSVAVPGFLSANALALHEEQIRAGEIDYVILFVAMSGAVPSEEPYSIVPFLRNCPIPVLCIPAKQTPPDFPLRVQTLYEMAALNPNVTVLDKGCDGLITEISQHQTTSLHLSQTSLRKSLLSHGLKP